MKKVIRKDLILETCGQKASKSHMRGCYIRFSDDKPLHSRIRHDCIVEYNSNGEVVGIEFYEGL